MEITKQFRRCAHAPAYGCHWNVCSSNCYGVKFTVNEVSEWQKELKHLRK